MSTRPPVFTWNEEIHFGPPSEPISVQKFLDDAEKLSLRGISPWLDAGTQATSKHGVYNSITGWNDWRELPHETRASIEMDCKVDNIRSTLTATLKSQKKVSYLQKTHAASLEELGSPWIKKRKDNQNSGDAGLEALKQAIEQTPLKMWRLKHAAKPYVRAGHVSDQNSLVTPQPKHPEIPHVLSHEVIITLTAYTRTNWYPYAYTRTCQHVLSSVCTLADLWSCISCDFKGDGSMPNEVFEFAAHNDDDDDGALSNHGTQLRARVVGYEYGDSNSDPDPAVIVIEDTAYCDGRGSPDYVDKLLSHLATFKPPSHDYDIPASLLLGPYERQKRSTPLRKGLPFHQVPLRSLKLRVNEPYWTLHRGICEHWFVIDEIRLQNPRDPPSGYPIAIQRTPTSRPVCRICSKVPSTLSIINDVRLGDSPSFVCRPCWELFGNPPLNQHDELNVRVVVVPMGPETV